MYRGLRIRHDHEIPRRRLDVWTFSLVGRDDSLTGASVIDRLKYLLGRASWHCLKPL